MSSLKNTDFIFRVKEIHFRFISVRKLCVFVFSSNNFRSHNSANNLNKNEIFNSSHNLPHFGQLGGTKK